MVQLFIALIVATACSSACSGSSSAQSGSDAGFTGAFTGTLPCIAGGSGSDAGTTNFKVVCTDTATGTEFLAFHVLPGSVLPAGSFNAAANVTALAGLGVGVLRDGGPVWVMSAHAGYPDGGSRPDQGSFNLTIASTGPELSDSTGSNTWNDSHGSYDAVLVPDPSTDAGGSVSVHMAF